MATVIERREYQEKAIRSLRASFKKHRAVIGVAPTASGKTVMGAQFILRGKYKQVLWIAHRIELLRQARKQIIRAGFGESFVGILSGPERINVHATVLVASINMLKPGNLPDDIDLVVIDECHHVAAAGYTRILEALPASTKVLGLTATPCRLDGKPLGDAFESMVMLAETAELAADGYIKLPAVYAIPREKAIALVKGVTSSGADYSPKQLDRAMRKQPLMADIVKEWKRLAEGRPTIVYACTVEHSLDLCRRFNEAGVTAEHVDWSTSDAERKAILGEGGEGGRLASGETQVVCNVGILTEGMDCPPVKCIVVARPTKSLALWIQMCGRAWRKHGRAKPIILDHAGNVWRPRLGLPHEPREWSLTEPVKVGGEAPVRRCEQCGAIGPAGAKECAECGAVFPMTERELAEREAELERVRDESAERLRREAILRKWSKMKDPPLGEAWVKRMMSEFG